jgi:hypothetical protein
MAVEVLARRADEWWALQACVDEERVFSQVRRLDEAAEAIADAFSTLGVRVSPADVELDVHLTDEPDAVSPSDGPAWR